MHTNFQSLKEHRLIFEAEQNKTDTESIAKEAAASLDSLKEPNATELVDTTKQVATETAKETQKEAEDLQATLDGANQAEKKEETEKPASPVENNNAQAPADGGANNPNDKQETADQQKPAQAELQKFTGKITEIFNDPEVKSAIAAIAAALKELLDSLKGNKAAATEGVRARGGDAPEAESADSAAAETTTEQNETVESRESKVKKELEAHVAEDANNSVDTLIAKKETEKAEKEAAADNRIDELDNQHDALKAELDTQENTLQDLEIELSRTDDVDAKDDLQAKIDMLKVDIEAKQKQLSILDSEIDEEVAKEDAINDLDKDVEALNALREKAEVIQEGLQEGINAFKESTEYADETVKTSIDGLSTEITRSLDVTMKITPDSEVALKELAQKTGIDMYANIENGTAKDPAAFMEFVNTLFTKLAEKKDAAADATPATPTENTPQEEPKAEGSSESAEQNEELQEWAKHLQERCDSKEFSSLNGMEVRVEGSNIVFVGTEAQVNTLLKYAAQRGMSPNIKKEGDKFILTTTILEHGDLGYLGENYDQALVEAQEKNALGKEEQAPAPTEQAPAPVVEKPTPSAEPVVTSPVVENPAPTTESPLTPPVVENPAPVESTPIYTSFEPSTPTESSSETQETTKLEAAKDAPIGQIRQDIDDNYWQKTNEGWVSYNNPDAKINSDSGFSNTTWSDSTMDDYGVKIIEAPSNTETIEETPQEQIIKIRQKFEEICSIANTYTGNESIVITNVLPDLNTLIENVQDPSTDEFISGISGLNKDFSDGSKIRYDIDKQTFILEKSVDDSTPTPDFNQIIDNNIDSKNIA
jgi:hypothetical protein